MSREFVPYQESLELKSLGFDEECFKYCLMGVGVIGQHKESGYLILPVKNSQLGITGYTQPLFQQAFRFFREKYNLNHEISHGGKKGKYYAFVNNYIYGNNGNSPSLFSYEEAELECLRKLIQIIKENGN